jgi:hypothetical protein
MQGVDIGGFCSFFRTSLGRPSWEACRRQAVQQTSTVEMFD